MHSPPRKNSNHVKLTISFYDQFLGTIHNLFSFLRNRTEFLAAEFVDLKFVRHGISPPPPPGTHLWSLGLYWYGIHNEQRLGQDQGQWGHDNNTQPDAPPHPPHSSPIFPLLGDPMPVSPSAPSSAPDLCARDPLVA